MKHNNCFFCDYDRDGIPYCDLYKCVVNLTKDNINCGKCKYYINDIDACNIIVDYVLKRSKNNNAKTMQDKCDNQLKNGCPFKDKLNEYFGKYRIGLCASRYDYTEEEFNIRYCTLMDLEKCVANAYIDLIYKGSTPDCVSVWKNYLDDIDEEKKETENG